MSKPFIAVLMGSDSDLDVMHTTLDTLANFNINFEVKITSAHRSPLETKDYIIDAEQRGCVVFIAAAGLAAHLAGAVAAHTTKPVIGVPINGGSLGGLDALLSTVQMPGGIPVACTAIGKPGAKNAAILAIQILALKDTQLADVLLEYKRKMSEQVAQKNIKLQEKLGIT